MKTFIEYHLPTGIFSLLSLISYFIEPDQVPGRMGMLMTLYLIAITSYASLNAPGSRGFSYIEIWFVGIQAPILMAILEYGIVLALRKLAYHYPIKQLTQKMDIAFFFISLLGLGTFNSYYWTLDSISG